MGKPLSCDTSSRVHGLLQLSVVYFKKHVSGFDTPSPISSKCLNALTNTNGQAQVEVAETALEEAVEELEIEQMSLWTGCLVVSYPDPALAIKNHGNEKRASGVGSGHETIRYLTKMIT